MGNQTPKDKMEDMSNNKKKLRQRPQLGPRRSALMLDKHTSSALVRMQPSEASSLEGQHTQDLHHSLQAMDIFLHSKVNNHRMACRSSLSMGMRTTRASLLSLHTRNHSMERRREDMSRRKPLIQHLASKGCSRQHKDSSK